MKKRIFMFALGCVASIAFVNSATVTLSCGKQVGAPSYSELRSMCENDVDAAAEYKALIDDLDRFYCGK